MLNIASESAASAPIPPIEPADATVIDTRYADYKIIRRNGAVVGFAPNKIAIAVTKAFIAVQGGQAAASARIRERVESITGQVTAALMRRTPSGGTFHIEDIQDQVELALMRSGEHEVARAYVLYREKRSQERWPKPAPDWATTSAPSRSCAPCCATSMTACRWPKSRKRWCWPRAR